MSPKLKGRGKMPKITVNPIEATRRMTICRDCEHLSPKTTICGQCKCFMHLKTQLKGVSCPIGRW